MRRIGIYAASAVIAGAAFVCGAVLHTDAAAQEISAPALDGPALRMPHIAPPSITVPPATVPIDKTDPYGVTMDKRLAPVKMKPTGSLYREDNGPYQTAQKLATIMAVPADGADAGRDIPLRVTYPSAMTGAAPVIVYSHGMFGSRHAYDPLVTHWASWGYIVVQPTHADSDARATLDTARAKQAHASRPHDIRRTIDAVARVLENIPDAPRADMAALAVAGHSFGAHTTQIVAGQKTAGDLMAQRMRGNANAPVMSDARPVAFIAISPNGPKAGRTDGMAAHMYDDMTRPMLMITGSNDDSPMDPAMTPVIRAKLFDVVPPKDKYLLYILGAYHSFGGISGHGRANTEGLNPMHLRCVKTFTLAFLDAYVRRDAEAARWLTGTKVLGPQTCDAEFKTR